MFILPDLPGHRRYLQRSQPDRWPGWFGHHADRDGGGRFALIAWTGNVNFANYLHIPYVPYTSELVIVCTAIVGRVWVSLVQHLPGPGWFMGTRVPGRGGAGTIAALVRQEFLLVIMGASS